MDEQHTGKAPSTRFSDALTLALTLALLAGLLKAVAARQIPLVGATSLFVLGALTVGFAGGFAGFVRRGEWPRFETSWGGLGGGLGGWRLSPALACLMGAVAFGTAFTLVTLYLSGAVPLEGALFPEAR